ncbi:glyoxalase/bleomycin resistance/dioxygenase family protein [Actinomadura sp. ATCC 31491]|uniref:Glyoxalase/bleomycin resistance/dioxygenase family protein n=1 Tax=Actinomadura luzonensis TaxID=2805427 RepID=A0ABT0G3T8_9ACTN|nr:VOC family protein [Actinomadura luzonensis]MCK2218791.1 glyoxalase/bleomycin resistance/dioxygenase family protein [Actinomadura luzonensis]
MPHHSRLCRIVIDVEERHHADELAFWQAATGTALTHYAEFPEFHGALLGSGEFGLLLQRSGEGPARVHLDIHTDDLDAEVARLERLGATRVRHVEDRWWIMRDPAGLPFCVVPEPPGALHEGNAQRWDDQDA